MIKKEEITILDAFSAEVGISSVQREAWDMLLEVGLPHKKSETYKFTPITSILKKNVNWNLKDDNIFNKDLLYDADGSHVVLVNGHFSEELSSLCPHLEVRAKEVSDGKHDPFSLLNTSLAQEELELISGDELPVFIYHFNSNGISNPRIKIRVKAQNTICVIEKVIGSKSNSNFTNSYIEFEVGRDAMAYHTKVQNYHDKVFTHETVLARVDHGGQFYNNTFSFEGAMVRNNLTINLDGENCEGHMQGLFLLDKKSHVDNHTVVDHLKPHSFSNEIYRGVLDEKSTGIFNGKIYVRQDAQKTNAFQSNNNILLSDSATIHAKPQLEIWADDVKCSHGCTSGQLDKEAIFYLRTRGIDERNAKAMLLNAFVTATMEHVKVARVREEIQQLIDKKLL